MTIKEANKIVLQSFIISSGMKDGINIFEGKKTLIHSTFVTNDNTEIINVYSVQELVDEPNSFHQFNTARFLIELYPKIFVRYYFSDVLKLIDAVKKINNYVEPKVGFFKNEIPVF